MRLGQVTIGASATPLLPSGTPNTYASLLSIQNNSAHVIRYGDNTVSTTVPSAVNSGTAGKGMLLNPGGAGSGNIAPAHGTLINSWYVAGTQGDVIDFQWENAQ